MHRHDVLRMIYRRAKAAALDVHACCHTFRATGITAYLEAADDREGTADRRARIAADDEALRPDEDELTLDEIERIAI